MRDIFKWAAVATIVAAAVGVASWFGLHPGSQSTSRDGPTPTASSRPTPVPTAVAAAFLDNLPPSGGDQPTEKGNETLQGKQYPESLSYGIGFASEKLSTQWDLGGGYSAFTATLGLTRASCGDSSARFELVADGKTLVNQVVMTGETVPVSVRLNGAGTVELVSDWGNNLCGAYAVWGDAMVAP